MNRVELIAFDGDSQQESPRTLEEDFQAFRKYFEEAPQGAIIFGVKGSAASLQIRKERGISFPEMLHTLGVALRESVQELEGMNKEKLSELACALMHGFLRPPK